MGKLILILTFVFGVILPLNAQDGCAPTESRKAQKLLDKAQTSRGSLDEIRDLYRQSLEADEQCLECRYALARVEYQIAMERNLVYDNA
ncbi:MAG TPA: hypothetical protein VJ911_10480, partial [Cryomorphaceae bacterium]|nr:hypothetical protein [Cryomorphaceae bacterium]